MKDRFRPVCLTITPTLKHWCIYDYLHLRYVCGKHTKKDKTLVFKSEQLAQKEADRLNEED